MDKVIIILLFLLLFSNCKKEDLKEKVATPTFKPTNTLHYGSVYVEINCETEGAIIYYTIDGNDPTTYSSVYDVPILIKSTTTIKAFAIKEGMDASQIVSQTYALNAILEWQQLYGGSNSDSFYSIQQTSDGGCIVAGSSESTDIPGITNLGSTDCYIIKINSSGSLEWQQMYGSNNRDKAKLILQTSDGGYIILGTSETTNSSSRDCYIIKINSSGDIVWQNKYGSSRADNYPSIIQTDDGGYILAFSYYISFNNRPVIELLKLDAKGNMLWQKEYSDLENCFYRIEMIRHIKATNDGGCIIAGCLTAPGYSFYSIPWNIFIIKLDSDANKEWQQEVDGDYPFAGGISSIAQSSDGGYVIVGRIVTNYKSSTTNYKYDGSIIKINSSGIISWQETYGDSDRSELFYSIHQVNNGGYIIAGYSLSNDLSSFDGYVIKIHSFGSVEWQQLYGGSNDDRFYSIQQTSDGGCIVAGSSESTDIPGVTNHGSRDGYIIKLSGDK